MGVGCAGGPGAKGSTRWERVSMAARNAGARQALLPVGRPLLPPTVRQLPLMCPLVRL